MTRPWFAVLTASLFCLVAPRAKAASTELLRDPRAAQLLFQTGIAGVFDGERNLMFELDYRFGEAAKGLRPWLTTLWATDGAIFAGGGLAFTFPSKLRATVSVGFGPGYYERHQGPDLGSHLEFLSYAEIGYDLGRRSGLSLRLSHISNGSLSDQNPGTELMTFGYVLWLP
jgi:lipid A 3-O-deacylase